MFVLPLLLFIAATASQLSAALADTIGGGGFLAQISPHPLSEKWVYLIVAFSATIIVWTTDVFGIINLASKGFAVFYFLQTRVATRLMLAQPASPARQLLALGGCAILMFAVLFVILFSQAAQHA